MSHDKTDDVAAASVFCAPGVTLQKDPGQASSSKQHKGDDSMASSCLAPHLYVLLCRIRHSSN